MMPQHDKQAYFPLQEPLGQCCLWKYSCLFWESDQYRNTLRAQNTDFLRAKGSSKHFCEYNLKQSCQTDRPRHCSEQIMCTAQRLSSPCNLPWNTLRHQKAVDSCRHASAALSWEWPSPMIAIYEQELSFWYAIFCKTRNKYVSVRWYEATSRVWPVIRLSAFDKGVTLSTVIKLSKKNNYWN